MKVRTIGGENPEHAIMYCVHGNEPCGKLAVERILHEELEFQKPVKLIFANEKAFNRGESHTERDLNRSWNAENLETHEARLAKKIRTEIQGLKVLDLHSSFSHPEAFGLKPSEKGAYDDEIDNLGLKYSVDISKIYNDQIKGVDRIAVECGYTRSQKAIENAYRITKNFLRSNNSLNGESEGKEPEKYKIYDKVEGSNFQFLGKNFQKVNKGQEFAIQPEEYSLKAQESFYPILMSTTGYDDMIGFKARKVDG